MIRDRFLLIVFGLFAGGGAAIPAAAASFDCAKAATSVEKTICADPALSDLDGKVAERFAAAMARSLDPHALHQAQREWLTARDKDIASLRQSYERRLARLDHDIIDLDAVEAARDMSEAAARTKCPAFTDDVNALHGTCVVDAFGAVGTIGGKMFVYGLYGFRLDDSPVGGTVVIYKPRGPDGRLRAVFSPGTEGTFFEKPKLLKLGDRPLLHLAGYESGTGNFNEGRLFVWRNGAWTDLDTESWLKDLAKRLPPGYGAWKGIYPDYNKMTAATPLWRENVDGNCCPTGGRADIALGWQGDRLIVKSVQVKLGAKYAEQF